MKPVQFSILALLFLGNAAFSLDHVITNKPQAKADGRLQYSYKLLEIVLAATTEEYGDYKISKSKENMQRNRQMIELRRGKLLNMIVSPPKPGWEQAAIRVKFPTMRGICSYRISLIKNTNRDMLKNVNSLEQVKNYSVGAHNQWSTAIVLRNNDFNIVAGPNYLALFEMLAKNRFELFPRGLNEIYTELDLQKNDHPNLMVEEHIALFHYLPVYFYVSPKTPRLAKRISDGLAITFENGEFQKNFDEHFKKSIDLAKLENRKIFSLDNSNITPEMLKEDKKYVLDFGIDQLRK